MTHKRNLPDAYTTVMNAQEKSPVYLFRIAVDDDVANDLFLAAWNEDVRYFRDARQTQVYTAAAITFNNVSESMEGSARGMTITIPASEANMFFAETTEGLRGNRVTVRQTFIESVAAKVFNAHVENVYIIDRTRVNDHRLQLILVSLGNRFNVDVPGRSHSKKFCQHNYKKEGCWVTDGTHGENQTYRADDGFDPGTPDTCSRIFSECDRHGNTSRFGGQRGIPTQQEFSL